MELAKSESGQAVAAVAKAGVVVVAADAGVQAHAIDDLPRVQAMGGGVGVELVEEGDAWPGRCWQRA